MGCYKVIMTALNNKSLYAYCENGHGFAQLLSFGMSIYVMRRF